MVASGAPFAKRGEGTLVVGSVLGDLQQEVRVEEGVYDIRDFAGAGNSTASLVVSNNATLKFGGWIYVDSNSSQVQRSKTIVIQGTGYDGQGALNMAASNCGLFHVTLSGDALIKGNTFTVRMYAPWDFNGHKLTLDLNRGEHMIVFDDNFLNHGDIDVKQGGYLIWEDTSIPSANTLTFSDGGVARFRNARNSGNRPLAATFVMNGGSQFYVDSTGVGLDETKNAIAGEVRLAGIVTNSTQTAGWPLSIEGEASGAEGGFVVRNGLKFRLGNAANSFGKGVVLNGESGSPSWLSLTKDGALPADGGPLTVEQNGVINLVNETGATFALPDLVCGEGTVITSKQYATGVDGVPVATAKSLIKTGDDCLVIYPALQVTGVADIRSGTLKFGGRIPSYITGLNFCASNYTSAAWRGYTTDNVPFQWVDPKGPSLAYQMTTADVFRSFDPRDYISSHFNFVYSGYVWNNEDHDVAWSFVGQFNRYHALYINDECIYSSNDEWGGGYFRVHGNAHATLKPGPNRFVFHMANNGDEYGAGGTQHNSEFCVYAPNGIYWTPFMALGYDTQNRGTTNHVDYAKMIEPGDGSLFTTTATPVKDHVDPAMYWPTFASIHFAGGTVLDLNDVTPYTPYPLVDLNGTMRVENGRVVLSGTWTVDAADLVAGGLTVGAAAELVIESGTKVLLTNVNEIRRRQLKQKPLITCSGGGTVVGTLTLADDSKEEWTLIKSPDGQSVIADCRQNGLSVILQ